MRVHVLSVGKLKDAAVLALCDEYQKRSRPLHPIERHEARDLDAAWRVAAKLGGPIVALDERGAQLDSTSLSQRLERWRDEGCSDISFLIGPADGFTQADRDRADVVLSLSKLTLPHRLAVVVLCEQLYRAGTISAGHPYHR